MMSATREAIAVVSEEVKPVEDRAVDASIDSVIPNSGLTISSGSEG